MRQRKELLGKLEKNGRISKAEHALYPESSGDGERGGRKGRPVLKGPGF